MRGGYGFVAHVAARYMRATRASGRIASSTLSVCGVAAGVMTLVAVMGVMNGFQLGFIEDIVEVSSYHLQIRGGELTRARLQAVRSAPGVRAVVAFWDNAAVVSGGGTDMRGCIVRGIEAGAPEMDSGFADHMDWREGRLQLEEPGTIAIGVELARLLGLGVGDEIRMLTLAGLGGKSGSEALRVTGVFETGYYDFDLGMAFVSLATADALFGEESLPTRIYGVKLSSRFADRQAVEAVGAIVGGIAEGTFAVTSWRDFNRAFFSALLFEKVLMLVVVGLIFVVVAFSIYHSLKRTVFERREEIALLAALGARRNAIRAVFVLEGTLIGLAGSVSGLIAGLAVSANVGAIIGGVEGVVNALLGAFDLLAGPFMGGVSGSFSIFSPAVFYLDEVTSRVLLPETIGITFAGVFSASAAALLASNRILGVVPAEILRYE